MRFILFDNIMIKKLYFESVDPTLKVECSFTFYFVKSWPLFNSGEKKVAGPVLNCFK